MDHNVAAEVRKVATVLPGALNVIDVGIVYAQRKMIAAVGIEQFNPVESFGHLLVAFAKLRTGDPARGQDWIGANKTRLLFFIERIELQPPFCFLKASSVTLRGGQSHRPGQKPAEGDAQRTDQAR